MRDERTHGEVVAVSAETRMAKALRELKRAVYGDAEYDAEVTHINVLDQLAAWDAPPKKRAARLRNYGWNKRMRGY